MDKIITITWGYSEYDVVVDDITYLEYQAYPISSLTISLKQGNYIVLNFNSEWTYTNEKGLLAIRKRILASIREQGKQE